jgi:hypothetical protein
MTTSRTYCLTRAWTPWEGSGVRTGRPAHGATVTRHGNSHWIAFAWATQRRAYSPTFPLKLGAQRWAEAWLRAHPPKVAKPKRSAKLHRMAVSFTALELRAIRAAAKAEKLKAPAWLLRHALAIAGVAQP